MPRTNYRPSIGETVFVSLSGNTPIRITVTGFRHHSYLKKEVMEYTRIDGSSSWSTYEDQSFYTEVPADTPYLYLLVLDESDENGSDRREEAFFFTPQEAFAHRDALLAGEVIPRQKPYTHPGEYTVEVMEVS